MRARTRIRSTFVLLCVALTATSVAQGPEPTWSMPEAPFPLRDLDGKEWRRADLHGKVVLIDFWATWCTPCLGELPHLKRAYQRHRDDGFEILAVSVDQTEPATLRRWIRTHGLPWPQLHDNRGFAGSLPEAFAVDLVPRSFLFDRSGRLVAVDLRGEAFEAAVAALADLGEQLSVGAADDGRRRVARVD